jgi:hypothetical protein
MKEQFSTHYLILKHKKKELLHLFKRENLISKEFE